MKLNAYLYTVLEIIHLESPQNNFNLRCQHSVEQAKDLKQAHN